MAATVGTVGDICAQARAAARALGAIDTATKDAALHAIAEALEDRAAEILEANAQDMEAGREASLSSALLDRLRLDRGRLAVARTLGDEVAVRRRRQEHQRVLVLLVDPAAHFGEPELAAVEVEGCVEIAHAQHCMQIPHGEISAGMECRTLLTRYDGVAGGANDDHARP